MAKHNLQNKLIKLEAQAESIVASEMLDDFSQSLLSQFKKRKDFIEDWQNLDETNMDQISNRLRVVALKQSWNKNDMLDLGLLSSLIWNEIVNGS